MEAKTYPEGSLQALCSAAISLFALLVAFLGYTSFKSTDPWSWIDLFVQVIPAILASAALVNVPFLATRERKADTEAESVRIARRMSTLGSGLVVFVVFTWFILGFINHHS